MTSPFKSVDEQLAYIKKGAAEIIPEDQLRASLENSRKTGKPLRVYLGVDRPRPTCTSGTPWYSASSNIFRILAIRRFSDWRFLRDDR